MEHKELSADELYECCEPGTFDFETTHDVKPIAGTIGQGRAMGAIDFGLGLESKGFNIYALGQQGTGRMTSIRRKITELAQKEPVPNDWCYVYNFRDPDVPHAVSLLPGRAADFKKDMDEMVHLLQVDIPRIFESKEFEKSRSRLMEEFQKEQKELFHVLEEEAKDQGFSIRKTVSGLLIVPVKQSGDPLTEEEFEKLEEDHKKRIEELGKKLQEKLDDVVRTVKNKEKAVKEQLQQLEREATLSAVGPQIEELKEKYKDHERIPGYLGDVQEDIIENREAFKGQEEGQAALPFIRPQKQEPDFSRYTVNVLVNNGGCQGAPCVFESNPTYYNLFGRVEHKFQYGAAFTDFSMIKAGSLFKANGGFIVMDALDLLRNIFSYESLKRALRNQEVKIEDVWEQYRLVSTTTLRPEPIPMDVKVVLIGNPYIYYLLYSLDEDYRELFKVKADFDSVMERTPESMRLYTEFIAAKCKEEGLLPLDRSGVARVIEHSSRLSGHRGKLSSKFSDISDLLRESRYWAGKDGGEVVTGEHVERAISEKIYRSNRIEERLQELMEEDTLIVESDGTRVGQVNGLAVLSMGDYMFGKPSRITARTFAGKAGVVNIERATKMSGKIHEKAILIISNYLGSTYATRSPISLSASITFEQLYDMVEGDSATCAELYALLSSIGGIPLRQDIAITGSMDQNGDVQPIGGVNEKIEGFFDLCAARGLTGAQGIIMPGRNVRNLMLKRAVVDAVREGRFHIYPMDRMEEGMEILTGMPAGEAREDGTYPEGTFNHLVMKRLDDIREALKEKKKEAPGEPAEEEEEEKNAKEEDRPPGS
jgi:lon-related putative ATP-dependent protease